MSILEISNLSLQFGGLKALSDISLSVPEGSIFSVIGPNGAGKTSFFNVISGVYQPTQGSITFLGERRQAALTKAQLTRIGFLSAGSGILLTLVLSIQELWQKVIIDRYPYQQSFPWRESFWGLFSAIAELPLSYSLLPFLVGAIIVFLALRLLSISGSQGPDQAARKGIARTFQNIRLFDELSVLDNVLVGTDSRLNSTFWHAALRLPFYFKERALAHEQAREKLAFVGLENYIDERAGSLSYGHRRRLEIARALASEPKLLLLDEPAAGLNPSEAVSLMQLIRSIKEKGISVILIEHQMKVVMGISDRIAVLDYGQKIAEGSPDEIKVNPKVIEAYLGKS